MCRSPFTVTAAPVPPGHRDQSHKLLVHGDSGTTTRRIKPSASATPADGTLTWTASDNAPWLTLAPVSGTGNGTVTLTAATGTLTAGNS